jgi:hypothetical protein
MNHNKSPRRSGPGCFAYGCLVATVIFCVVMGSIWYFGLRSMRSAVDQYTATTAEAFPSASPDPSVASTANTKVAELNNAAREQRASSVEFSEQEVQALIEQTPWRNWVRVNFGGEDVVLKFSFPLAALGDWVAASFLVGDIKERFLVGSAKCRFGFNEGQPKLAFLELVLNEKTLEDLPRGHAAEWIVGAVSQSVESAKTEGLVPPGLKGLREVVIRDSRLVVAVGP